MSELKREPDKYDAIQSLAPEVAYFEDEDGSIVWEAGRVKEDGVFVGSRNQQNVVPPTEQEISDQLDFMRDQWDATEYARNRKLAYPTIGDQLDALFHAGVFPEEMAAQIQAVKDEYPKSGA